MHYLSHWSLVLCADPAFSSKTPLYRLEHKYIISTTQIGNFEKRCVAELQELKFHKGCSIFGCGNRSRGVLQGMVTALASSGSPGIGTFTGLMNSLLWAIWIIKWMINLCMKWSADSVSPRTPTCRRNLCAIGMRRVYLPKARRFPLQARSRDILIFTSPLCLRSRSQIVTVWKRWYHHVNFENFVIEFRAWSNTNFSTPRYDAKIPIFFPVDFANSQIVLTR